MGKFIGRVLGDFRKVKFRYNLFIYLVNLWSLLLLVTLLEESGI